MAALNGLGCALLRAISMLLFALSVSACSGETDIFDRHLALEEAIVGSPLTTGNRVALLRDGSATYQSTMAAIGGARVHINIETYMLDDDAVGRRFAQALIDKQSAGVQVNLIHDSAGTLSTPPAFFKRITDAAPFTIQIQKSSVASSWFLRTK